MMEEIQTQIIEQDPLKLDINDDDFVVVMDHLLAQSRKFFSEYNLFDRRKKNEEYYLGNEISNLEKSGKLRDYNARYLDNVIFEAEGTLKAVAVSHVPDLVVTPGNNSDVSKQVAEELTLAINSKLRKRENRQVLGRAYIHRPIYFVGVIKAVWDDTHGKNGDYYFECIHPNNIDIDPGARDGDADKMNWIAHHYELSIKEILMRWPNKRKALLTRLGLDVDSGINEKRMASKLRISEIWFRWYKKHGDKWQKLEGVAWKYKDVVFDKIKNPYWDWEGETVLFNYDIETGKKTRAGESDVRELLASTNPMQRLSTERIYYNYFQQPQKPFIFLVHKQLGLHAYDETTRIEQSLLLQDAVNVRGRQITELISMAKGKNVFSTESGLKHSDVQAIDWADPDEDLLINGNLRDVYMHIPGVLPTAALFQDQNMNRERLFSKMGTNAALRGVRSNERTATQTQLYKESDFTRVDDEVESTINTAAERMAEWAMQFIRLFYTEEHFETLSGKKGALISQSIHRDMIEDGMVVKVSASSVDKLRRKREAFELVGIGMIDPVQFFKDIEASDPEGRARALMVYQMSPPLYMQKYIEKRDTTGEQAAALEQISVQSSSPSEGVLAQPPQSVNTIAPMGEVSNAL